MSFREMWRFGINRRGAGHNQEGAVTDQVSEEAMHCCVTIHHFTEKNLGGMDFHHPAQHKSHFIADYGVSLLIRVFQSPSAVRVPGPWLAPPHVPSRLSPEPPAKNGPPQAV